MVNTFFRPKTLVLPFLLMLSFSFGHFAFACSGATQTRIETLQKKSSLESKANCGRKFSGKTVQFEYDKSDWKSYFLTFSIGIFGNPVSVGLLHASRETAIDESSGYTWKIHLVSESFVVLETVYPGWEGYLISHYISDYGDHHHNEVKLGLADLKSTQAIPDEFHIQIFCSDCATTSECEIVHDSLKLYPGK